MDAKQDGQQQSAYKYEAVFCIFLAMMAYLGKDNADLVYPQILFLFLLLMSLNLAAILALRFWPSKDWLSAGIVLANCGVVTAILQYSGGPSSNLWVLYLLPISTAALLLSGREVAWVAAGAVVLDTAIHAVAPQPWSSGVLFELSLEIGLFLFSAALTWRLVSAERLSLGQIRRQREALARLEEESRAHSVRDERTESLAQVGLISAGIVHDLKTPLMVIGGYADMCLKNGSLDLPARQDVERIRRSVRLCQSTVSAILSAARKEDLPFVACAIEGIIDSALSLCGDLFIRADVTIEKQFDEGGLRVLGRPEHLERLFINLLGNAVKAMPMGGRLTIRTMIQRRSPGMPLAQVLIEDTGAGISEEAMAKLFKPFATTRPLEGGTGLGLYLCQDIAFKHGGSLKAENRASGGARFMLSLPVTAGAASAPAFDKVPA